MPLVRIDVNAIRPAAEVRAISDAIHTAIVEVYGIPERDRFHVISEHSAGQIIAEDAGLGFERTSGVVIIQIFTQRGRSDETKQRLYATINDRLAAVGVVGEDVFIGYVENGPQDWSFGFGRAQYVTGELGVPAL
ncbi:tautomerase family protein [Schumannella luteola]|uniref:Phenylpyruvate tautomerase PptA (4-oxalocrotonate tautomerase family) n=1 Tax=Schumannella luteola TaxID=472059 RepID=A0A852Y4G2_9MICO|nr:tautomerase family protein [Schumannella luteola]NYG97806.1 phenylpyruvate tautomerase PptA (4-oxalocrotonate tautomerase family) [Schumannella luteola]TPX02931.1 tautomerase family protein [Schumannella luteola]